MFLAQQRAKLALLIFVFLIITVVFKFSISAYSNKIAKSQIFSANADYSKDPQAFYTKTLLVKKDWDLEWQPGKDVLTYSQPEISAKSAFAVELGTGNVYYDKNPKEKMKIASITKMMTAVVAIEHKNIGDLIYVTRDSAYVGENTMGLTAGEVYTVEELLYGLLLNSGNDAAYALAEGVAGDVGVFVDWMNIKAKELGLENTVYTDPSGLDDGNESTAEDLVKLTKYFVSHDKLVEITSTVKKEFTKEDELLRHKPVYLENQTNLVGTYPGVRGIKTGYTEAAGLCLVTYAELEGKRIAAVVLDSANRRLDMVWVLDHVLESLGIVIED